MSEHELRVQRSLQKLDIPDWFRNRPQQETTGFLFKRNSTGGCGDGGLSSKTTSLSSLGSAHSATPRSNLLSPSPTPSVVHGFSRWSTSRLNSMPGGTSPCASTRSSFNYRQPYLGWRSQERIVRPRTPAERLAAGLLPQKPQVQPQNVPNLSEVHSSIKEVTSAIANYVSEANKGGVSGSDDRLSPGPQRSASPRGSTGRLCWLESSFVGSRPIDVPDTPVSSVALTGGANATPLVAVDHNRNTTQLYLDLTPTNRPKPVAVNGE
ncbi:hypothetical protein AAG570_011399 [Ranatra chinensis]|uniref:Uncharacterized protein n=1 Tax=Ranatra chinensis TaxID=642074 RepID=A0ABD0YKJ1_9HEMI